MAKQGSLSVARGLTRSLLGATFLSALLVSAPAFAGETIPPPAPSSSGSLPTASNPANNSTMGQMMAMQQAAMGQNANVSGDPFQGNVPKSTSLSANFAWMDTFDANALNGGYGGGVTMTHWITSHFGITGSIEIESFGLGSINQLAKTLGQPDQAGTPVIPITLGAVYDFFGGRSWVNPQIFADAGPAVSLNGETMPLYADAGFGVVTPLAKISDTLAGVDLFANIRWAYLSNISGLADTAVGAIGAGTNAGTGTKAVGNLTSQAISPYKGALNYMPIEFGATFVF
ncbi:MAG: hypothetical protein M0Z25_00775 [Nitrospiraceae bacterium]|nr:hypothetical protein [Nitrospiraceae bacterium]